MSPGLMESRKLLLVGLYLGGVYIRRVFGLTGDLSTPKDSPFGVQSERQTTIFNK